MSDDDAQALRDGLASLVRDRRANPTQGGIRAGDYGEFIVEEENVRARVREWCDPLDIAEMEVDVDRYLPGIRGGGAIFME